MHSLKLLKIGQSIWHYLLSHGITIAAEYLPSKLNVQVDWKSWNYRDPSGWKLHQSMFQSIIKHFGYPIVDLFASRLCHQLRLYVEWKPDPNSIAADGMQQCWNKIFPYTFPPFSLISQILKNMGNTTLVSSSVEDVNAMPIAVDTIARSTVRSSKKQTFFNSEQETNVSGLKGYRKSLETEEISSNAAKLISQSRRSGPIASQKSTWKKWTSWCVREKMIHFLHL